MLEWISYSFLQRFSSAPLVSFLYVWIPRDGILVSIIYFVAVYIGYLSHIPSLLLTLNRLTSVLFPVSHEKVCIRDVLIIKVVSNMYKGLPGRSASEYVKGLFLNRVTKYRIINIQIWEKGIKFVLIIYFAYPLIFSIQFLFTNQVRHCQLWDSNQTISYHAFLQQPPIYWVSLS